MSSPETPGRRVRVVTVLLLVGVFAAGGLAGAGVDRWLAGTCAADAPPPPAPPLGPMELVELGLSPEQQQQARAIGERHRPELEALRRELMPRALEIHERMQRELREVLTPAQRQRLDELLGRRRDGPPPDPFAPGGPPGPPPLGASAACASSAPEAPCRFTGRFGAVEGTCRVTPDSNGTLVCVPAGGPPPPPAP
jgi:hypothetical protein